MKQLKRLAVVAGLAALVIAPTTALGGGKQPPPCGKKHTKKCPTVKKGRMTGHGQIVTTRYGKAQWEFRNSICGADRFPDLKVEWGSGQRFVLTAYSVPLRCVDTPANEENPTAGFDTIIGQGTGRLNGVAGASATFRFTDNGEPGRNDTATITILDAGGNPVLELDNVKAGAGGNHQAHRLTGAAARG